MLAWSEGTDNGRQKTRNHEHVIVVQRELFTDLPDHSSQTCHAKPKLKSTGAGRYQLLPVMEFLPQAVYCDFPKSQDAVALQQIKERGALPTLIVVISVRAPTVAAISGLHCRALVMVVYTRLTA